MGGYVAHDAVASATRSPLSLKRHSMLTWTEKGERLHGEMHSINLFSDAFTRQVEALVCVERNKERMLQREVTSARKRSNSILAMVTASE